MLMPDFPTHFTSTAMPAKLHAPANAPVLAALLRIQSRPGLDNGVCACGIDLSARAYAVSCVSAFPGVCLSNTWVTYITCRGCCNLPNSLACVHEAGTHAVVQELPPNITAATLPEVIDQASGSAVDTPGLRAGFQPSAVAAAPGVPTKAQPGPGVPAKAASTPGLRARPAPAQADSVTATSVQTPVQPGVRRLRSSTSLAVAAA